LEKRDPSPETQVNEYRDAYLERFQLANTSLGRWQSDRGRVFILYSKPEATFKTEDKERINSYD
jgi:GWxTD domain-containing protein